jgi:protein TonB
MSFWRRTREHAAALAAANKAAQEKAELASARQAEEAAAQADRAAQSAATSHPGPQVQLKLTHYVAPDYPPSALAHNVTGSVTVAYTVDEKGGTRDVRVVSAEPAGIFDRDTVAAVKRWRYAPVMVDNAAVAVPARTAIQFTPQ